MNVTILGSGAFGLALGKSFYSSKNKVTIWSKFKSEVNHLKGQYFDFSFTDNMSEAVRNADIIVIAVPIEFVSETLQSLKQVYQQGVLLVASKGIQITTSLFAYQMVDEIFPDISYGVLSGGTFAKDMMLGKVMGITLATTDLDVANVVKNSLSHSLLKVEKSLDIIGVSVCGAIKNVMAIGFGILDGADYPPSTKFLYLTEAILEIKQIILQLGGCEDTILSYAGIDDIMMTCTSSDSRNYTLGKMIGQNLSQKEIDDYKNQTTIEGLGTCKALFFLLKKKKLESHFIQIIYQILYDKLNYHYLVSYLENIKK